jgi:hypothetical protein
MAVWRSIVLFNDVTGGVLDNTAGGMGVTGGHIKYMIIIP